MAEVHHFAYGWLTPALAYGVSVLGSLLGLVCTARSRRARTASKRLGWVALSAVSIGGTGIWLMHFLAMLGFSVVGSEVRYSVAPTVLSALLAIVVVGAGLLILGHGELQWWRVLAGGLFAGLGVAGMHYTGMAAMRLNGAVGYDAKLVVLSLVIAVVAASAALWFTVVARNLWQVTGAALIMGVAVNGMHYVGMAASRVTLDNTHSAAEGVDVTTALPVIAGLAGIIVVVLLYSALSAPIDEEARAEVPAGRPSGPAGAEAFWTPRTVAPQPAATSAGSPTGATSAGSPTGAGSAAGPWAGGSWVDADRSGRGGPQPGGPGTSGNPVNGQAPEWPTTAQNGASTGGQPSGSRWAALQQRGDEPTGRNPWAEADPGEAGRNRNSPEPW